MTFHLVGQELYMIVGYAQPLHTNSNVPRLKGHFSHELIGKHHLSLFLIGVHIRLVERVFGMHPAEWLAAYHILIAV